MQAARHPDLFYLFWEWVVYTAPSPIRKLTGQLITGRIIRRITRYCRPYEQFKEKGRRSGRSD